MGCCIKKLKKDGEDKINSITPGAKTEIVRNYRINAKSKILGSG
jgi:aspartate carbamoyltransferase regulatory subunit